MAKARAEQQELGFEGGLTLEKLKQMTDLAQILKEVERLYPPVGSGFSGSAFVNPNIILKLQQETLTSLCKNK